MKCDIIMHHSYAIKKNSYFIYVCVLFQVCNDLSRFLILHIFLFLYSTRVFFGGQFV